MRSSNGIDPLGSLTAAAPMQELAAVDREEEAAAAPAPQRQPGEEGQGEGREQEGEAEEPPQVDEQLDPYHFDFE